MCPSSEGLGLVFGDKRVVKHMPSGSQPAAAALPILEPLAQQVELLKAVVASQAEQILEIRKQAGTRCAASRATATKCEALGREHAKLLQEKTELNAKYTGTLEQLAEAQQRELDRKSSVCGQVVDWFANGQGNPTFAHEKFPNFVELHQQARGLPVLSAGQSCFLTYPIRQTSKGLDL